MSDSTSTPDINTLIRQARAGAVQQEDISQSPMARAKTAYLEAGGTEDDWRRDQDKVAEEVRRRIAADAAIEAIGNEGNRRSNDDIRRQANRNRFTATLED